MTTPQLERSARMQRGVTLIEILVTLVIMSVGLLGVAALQTVSLQHGQDAHARSQATALANDILDRMRANPDNARAGRYDIKVSDGAAASPSTIAEADVKDWKTSLAALLPNGNGSIVGDAAKDPMLFTITVQWGEREKVLTFTSTTVL